MPRPRSVGLLLVFITLLVYLPVTSDHFISFDDPQYVTENPFVSRGLTWTGIKWAFSSAYAANWHPLTWLSLMLDCDVFRFNPAGFHLVNMLFHALNAGLLFALLFRLTEKIWPSALTAALFAWHPLHVESVAWIAERKDVLSTFFSLLALLSYTNYAQKKTNPRTFPDARPPSFDYGLALVFFALALMSKAMPVTLPLVLLLLDFWPLKRLTSMPKQKVSLVLEKIPFVLLSFIVCIITLCSQHHAESSLANVSVGLRLENAVAAYAGYLGKMIWPLHLAIYYPLHFSISWLWFAESAFVLAGISAIVWLERRANPWLIVGWLWFLITLLPVIGLVQVGGQSMADRYTYLPLIGIFVAVSFSLSALAGHFLFLKKGLVAVSILILGTCISLTEVQLTYWYDNESLFRHALEVEDSDIAHISLGNALQEKHLNKEALLQYILAWRISPNSVLPNANIAGVLAEQNKPELAAVYYQRAVQSNTWCSFADENYGRVLVTLKHYDQAMKEFAAAAKINPAEAKPHSLAARLLLLESNDVEAVKQLREAVKLEPDNLDVLILAAQVMSSSKDPKARNGTEARELAMRAVQLTNNKQPTALDVLAMSRAEMGEFGDAAIIELQAIKLADAAGLKEDVLLLQKRLQLYEKREPWRESFSEK